MIYSNSDNMELGLDASVLSVKVDFDRKIGIVQERYTDTYNAIISEYNSLVEFLDEFKRMANVIIDECNRLQGLTDEELTNIKAKIEELKNILDSIDIPDLPSIKPPEEFFGDDGDDEEGEEEDDDTVCHIGFGVTVEKPSMPHGTDISGEGTTYFCREYGDGTCKNGYVLFEGNFGTCLMNYDASNVSEPGAMGCMNSYVSTDSTCLCDLVYEASTVNGVTCTSGYVSAGTGVHHCQSNFIEPINGDIACSDFSSVNYRGEQQETCMDYSSFNGRHPSCEGGYRSYNGTSCPNQYNEDSGLWHCVVDYTKDTTACTRNFNLLNDNGTAIGNCEGGFSSGGVSCDGSWAESSNNSNTACALNYTKGSITCHNYYLTDGDFAGCGSGDNICSPCIGTYCPSYSSSCTGCDNPRCYGCDNPNCHSNDGCGEGETPVVPPCGEGCDNCEAVCQNGDAPSCGNYDEANCGSTAKGAWDGCTGGQPICAGIWCGMSQSD